jgi:branched-chain amino acid transport system permease protein
VIGGTGSVWGVVVATVGLTLLPEVSRAAADYRLLIFGAMLIVVMRFSPGGLAGLAASVTALAKRKATP